MQVVLASEVARKQRVAQKVANVLHHILLRIKPEMDRSGFVAPFDAVASIEQDHAIRRSLDGGKEFLQTGFAVSGFALPGLQQAPGPVGHLPPQAIDICGSLRLAPLEPEQKLGTTPKVDQYPQQAGRQQAQNGALLGIAAAKQKPAQQGTSQLEQEKTEKAPRHARIVEEKPSITATGDGPSGDNPHHAPFPPETRQAPGPRAGA